MAFYLDPFTDYSTAVSIADGRQPVNSGGSAATTSDHVPPPAQLSTSPSSVHAFRSSGSVEAGEYRPLHRQHRASLSLHSLPEQHQQQRRALPHHHHLAKQASTSSLSPTLASHAQAQQLPTSPLLASASSSSSSSSVTRSVSITDRSSSRLTPTARITRARASSQHRIAYSPTTVPLLGGASNGGMQPNPTGFTRDTTIASPDSLSAANAQQQQQHVRASPSLGGGASVLSSLSTNMRRGLSYDGGYASPSRQTHGGSLQSTSLLPTSYAGRVPSGAPYSPMTGVQTLGSTSPSNFVPPPPQFLSTGQEYMRTQSYSPSRYMTTGPSSGSTVPPPPLASGHQIAPSFYAHHIPSGASGGGASPASTPPALQPPRHTDSPAHHPQAQQYYQSQQYLDSTFKRHPSQPSASGSAQLSAHAQQHANMATSPHQTPHRASVSIPPTAHNAAMFYAAGQDMRGIGGATSAPAGTEPRQSARKKGLRRIWDPAEIVRKLNPQPSGRRADPAGGFVSPLKALTVHLPQTYHLVNPAFKYESSLNPRRVLTKPSKPALNDGYDNEDSDYILFVNDVLGPEDKDRYLILDVLGQGTFGQVVKCQNMRTHEIVAVKVVKNKPAYFQQSMMEVTILELINNQWDKDDEHHMLRLKDTFIHHSHLCLVFELLSNNLYELIKQNSFRGLSTSLVRVFTAQLLDALTVLHEAKIIHCDLKPENILLKSLQSPTIKVIDFGSACHEKQTVYTYIQSRFYRSPEVILSLPYSCAIDMWSLGCICVELFLGLPLFPGTSEFNQITRIVEMLGMPSDHMLDKGKQTSHFFEPVSDEYGRRRWRLKSLERYSAEYKVQEQPSKKYFSATTLPEIIKTYPIVRKGLKEAEIDKGEFFTAAPWPKSS
ncbi:dual specificity protein kinase yak1 [Microbotryomycetes sp. JL201]|nr:dual specificity protein kinase yak1 [Microbotryomycetes sp. JL201]